MFDNFINKLKNQATNFSNTFKHKTDNLNLDYFKVRHKISIKGASNQYSNVSQHEDDWNLSPRAYTSFHNSTKCPYFLNNTENMEWVPNFPTGYDNSIIERFIRVITINDDPIRLNNVGLFRGYVNDLL